MRSASLAVIVLMSHGAGRLRDLQAAADQLRRRASRPCWRPSRPSPCRWWKLPKPLPLPGQLKPLPGARSAPEPRDPRQRVDLANAAARIQPSRSGYLNAVQVYPFAEGALYQVYSAPGQVTDIALQEGEQLVGSGPVAAGDTVRWIIGDTESGTAAAKKVHILVKPTRPDLITNLVINTDRRTYHLELRSTERTYMASVSWIYPQDQLIALRRQNALADAAAPVETGLDINRLRFRYAIEGDNPPWRPLHAFDDGKKVYIEFPRGIGQGEMPPLVHRRPRGQDLGTRQLPGARQPHDRRSAVRRGGAASRRRRLRAPRAHRAHRRETCCGERAGAELPIESRPRSRGGAAPAARAAAGDAALAQGADRARGYRRDRGLRRADLGALPRTGQAEPEAASSTTPRTRRRRTASPTLPRDYTGVPCRESGAARSVRRCPAISAGRCSMRRSGAGPGAPADRCRAAAARPGNRGGPHQPSVRHDQHQGATHDADRVAGRPRTRERRHRPDRSKRPRSIPTRFSTCRTASSPS